MAQRSGRRADEAPCGQHDPHLFLGLPMLRPVRSSVRCTLLTLALLMTPALARAQSRSASGARVDSIVVMETIRIRTAPAPQSLSIDEVSAGSVFAVAPDDYQTRDWVGVMFDGRIAYVPRYAAAIKPQRAVPTRPAESVVATRPAISPAMPAPATSASVAPTPVASAPTAAPATAAPTSTWVEVATRSAGAASTPAPAAAPAQSPAPAPTRAPTAAVTSAPAPAPAPTKAPAPAQPSVIQAGTPTPAAPTPATTPRTTEPTANRTADHPAPSAASTTATAPSADPTAAKSTDKSKTETNAAPPKPPSIPGIDITVGLLASVVPVRVAGLPTTAHVAGLSFMGAQYRGWGLYAAPSVGNGGAYKSTTLSGGLSRDLLWARELKITALVGYAKYSETSSIATQSAQGPSFGGLVSIPFIGPLRLGCRGEYIKATSVPVVSRYSVGLIF